VLIASIGRGRISHTHFMVNFEVNAMNLLVHLRLYQDLSVISMGITIQWVLSSRRYLSVLGNISEEHSNSKSKRKKILLVDFGVLCIPLSLLYVIFIVTSLGYYRYK
jgi:hypothetical protein